MNQKALWEGLAEENSSYYIYTPGGRDIKPEDYRISGLVAYIDTVREDELIPKGGTILDFGCGNGRLSEFMAKDFKLVIGTDISSEMLRQAKERLGEYPVWIETDGMKLPEVKDSSVDVVLAHLVFPHMKTRKMVESNMAEISRVLVKDGIFKVYMKNDLGKEKDNRLDKWWNGITYDEPGAHKLVKDHGFDILKTEFNPRRTNYWMWLKKT